MQSKAPENVSGSLRCNKQAGIPMIRGACRKRCHPVGSFGAAVKVLSRGIWRGSSGRVRVRRWEGRGCPDQCSSCPVYRRHTYHTPRGRRHVGLDLRGRPEVFCHPCLLILLLLFGLCPGSLFEPRRRPFFFSFFFLCAPVS